MAAVDRALTVRYGDNASLRCYQSSLGIQQLLRRYGIASDLIHGVVCMPERCDQEGRRLCWGGYFGEDHHVWVRTARRELVDLSITRMHKRPIASARHSAPVPAFWWHEQPMPSCIVYLSDGPIETREFSGADERDTLEFVAMCEGFAHDLRQGAKINRLRYGPVVTGIKDLDALWHSKNPWAETCVFFNAHQFPYPDDIQRRIAERYAPLQQKEAK